MSLENNDLVSNLRKNLEILKSRRILAFLALQTVKASNVCVNLFNHTVEGNVFNICRESVYLRCIVEVRKMLEPYDKNKTVNLSYLIKHVYKNREYFAQDHYGKELGIGAVLCGKTTPDFVSYFEGEKKFMANEERNKCLQRIERLNHRWNVFWNLLGKDKPLFFIRDIRDMFVHSMSVTTIFMPPINKMQKIINLILWFIKELDYIINDVSLDCENLSKQSEMIAYSFWNKMNI